MSDPVIVSLPASDVNGRSAGISINLPTATSDADAITVCNDMVEKLDAATGLVWKTNAAITRPLTLTPTGIKTEAVADTTVAQGWNLGFNVANVSLRYSVRVAAFLASLHNGTDLDTSEQLVQDVIAAFVAATPVTGTVAPQDRYGNDIQSFIEASYSTRKVSK